MLAQATHHAKPAITPEVGMGVTCTLYTDAVAMTIVRVHPSGKTFWATQDKATLKPDWKPEIIPGGFAGHCVHNYSQEYDYETVPGPEHQFRLTKKGWSCKHYRKRVRLGVRAAFHDYNF